jgi:CBS-domain-containing membrane protein
MLKHIFEFVLAVIIIFFVWNILKRLFFNAFYKNFPTLNPKNQQQDEHTTSKKMPSQKVKWDAETVDFEEIKEDKKQ